MSFAKSASNDPVNTLSVPSFARVAAKPDPHVTFTIAVSLPTRSYSVQQRYSAFDHLHQKLAATCGAPPPSPLPLKHPGSWFLSPLKAGRELSDEQLEERREGLERWLRAILSDRDPRWRDSRAFKEFLAAPPDGQVGASERKWSATTWTAEHHALEEEGRQLRTLMDKRDSQLLANSAAAHATAKEAKTKLVDLVRRLGDLTRALETLAKEGMTEGELQRRSGSAKQPTRVLGAAAAASLETPETRPLDNGGIMQLQQQYMDDQDTKLEALTAALRRQRHLGEMINSELALQGDILDQVETGTDRVQGKMELAQKQMKRL
ncbi:SNARE and Phox domain containing protein [Rhodotorula toruloides]|uniref:SNARE and Phox domain containing protein n=1 Tax=Rhodotorula toruloides TaxID=5286 RepID=A0A511K9D8_RHOTO|nr:SNARE and Phox domain containing protein [Rhodotorula toruloides]